MAVNLKYTPEQIREALIRCRGMVYTAARTLGCAPATVYNYMQRYPDLKEVVDNCRGEMVDVAELKLYECITEKQPWAVCFFLKTQAKNRGYVERQELVQFTEDQVDALIERELAAAVANESELPPEVGAAEDAPETKASEGSESLSDSVS